LLNASVAATTPVRAQAASAITASAAAIRAPRCRKLRVIAESYRT
jgi:hypothetical protein